MLPDLLVLGHGANRALFLDHVAQFGFQNLAVIILGQGGNKDIAFGLFEPGDLIDA